MKYHEILKKHIAMSNLSYRELSKRCKDEGTKISISYISQLINGDVPPASEDITRVLARVIGFNANELIFLSYIEKAPNEIKRYFENPELFSGIIHEFDKSLNMQEAEYIFDKIVEVNLENDKKNAVWLPVITAFDNGDTDTIEHRLVPYIENKNDYFYALIFENYEIYDYTHDVLYALIRKEESIQDNSIVLVLIDNKLTLQRVTYHGDLIIYKSWNKKSELITLPKSEAEILGLLIKIEFDIKR